jgi:hypothetical protein
VTIITHNDLHRLSEPEGSVPTKCAEDSRLGKEIRRIKRGTHNADVRAMTKPRIRSLFPGLALDLEPITVIPPVARRLGPLTDGAYALLAAFPLLRSRYLGLLQR